MCRLSGSTASHDHLPRCSVSTPLRKVCAPCELAEIEHAAAQTPSAPSGVGTARTDWRPRAPRESHESHTYPPRTGVTDGAGGASGQLCDSPRQLSAVVAAGASAYPELSVTQAVWMPTVLPPRPAGAIRRPRVRSPPARARARVRFPRARERSPRVRFPQAYFLVPPTRGPLAARCSPAHRCFR